MYTFRYIEGNSFKNIINVKPYLSLLKLLQGKKKKSNVAHFALPGLIYTVVFTKVTFSLHPILFFYSLSNQFTLTYNSIIKNKLDVLCQTLLSKGISAQMQKPFQRFFKDLFYLFRQWNKYPVYLYPYYLQTYVLNISNDPVSMHSLTTLTILVQWKHIYGSNWQPSTVASRGTHRPGWK